MRPFVPAQARGRVHATSPEDADGRALVLSVADVFVAAEGGDPSLAWEARACGCAVVAPLPAGSLDLDAPGLGFAVDQPALAAAAAARLLDDPDLRAKHAAEGRAGRRRAGGSQQSPSRSSRCMHGSTRAGACTGARRSPAGR